MDSNYRFWFLSDYFISGVRKKVEDLCGCNDELIRPLNELSDLGPRPNRNSSQGIKPSHQNTKQQEDERNIFNQESEQVSKSEFKQNKSHSVWWKYENAEENLNDIIYNFRFFYTSMRKRDSRSAFISYWMMLSLNHWLWFSSIYFHVFWSAFFIEIFWFSNETKSS